MEINIAGYNFKLYDKVQVNMKYDAIASTFSFSLYYDNTNPIHRKIFKPLSYQPCIISHNGVRLLTGVVLNHVFASSGKHPSTLVHISGYSKTGVLQDCVVANSTLQLNGLKFADIANTVCSHYGLKVIIDPEVIDACNTVIPSTTPRPDETVSQYLNAIATHLNVILSHDRWGNVVLTKVKSDKMLTNQETMIKAQPVPVSAALEGADAQTRFGNIQAYKERAILYNFKKQAPCIEMIHEVTGQKIHSDIKVVSQFGSSDAPALVSPYFAQPTAPDGRGVRPYTAIQSRTIEAYDNAASLTARALMGNELKHIRLKIKTDRWILNNSLITPNQMVTAQNDEVYMFNTTKWFIQEAILSGDNVDETAELICVPPSAFGTDQVYSIY